MARMERSAVDVVVPYAGSADGLAAVVARLADLKLGDDDTVTVVDNRGVPGAGRGRVRVARLAAPRSSYSARNAGAALSSAPWLLFLDGDVVAPADLLARYFAREPAAGAGVLAGAVVDAPVEIGGPAAARYASLKASTSQETTLAHGPWAFAQTANCAVRREAFAAVGGFAGGIRSGGDADLCWRLRAAGWTLERREEAAVVHRNRATVAGMLGQRARHGAGAAWLGRRHPGALPARRPVGLAWWATRRAASGSVAALRGDSDAALLGLLDGPAVWAFELGRLVPNRPLLLRR
jgi:GT2 family glycosyltransferase